MNKSILIFAFLFIGLMISSCRSVKNLEIRDLLHHSNCNQQNVYEYTEDSLPIPLHEQEISPLLDKKLSFNSLNMANAIGILDLVSNYVELKQNPKGEDLNYRLTLLELKQAIDQKINTSSLEISAISSEMDCEEERTSQVANYLKAGESEMESKLTVAAIVVGATGAIATGGAIKNETASNTAGITTGIAEASLGLLMLFNNRKIDFYHQRNALREVWEGKPVSSGFPPFVWYYLNYTDPGKNVPSVRTQIIDKWKNFGQVSEGEDEEGITVTPVYFGAGGKYTTEQLVNRADMYDQLESHITLMKQDLKALSLALERL